jgi:hypothetical protein
VSHFRGEIPAGCRQFLRRGDLSPQEVAETLSAIVLMDRLSPAAALDELLRARMAAARALLEPPKADAAAADEAAVDQALHRLVDVVVATVKDVQARPVRQPPRSA